LTMNVSYPPKITHDTIISGTNLMTTNLLGVNTNSLSFSDSKYPTDIGALLVDAGGATGLTNTSGWSTWDAAGAKTRFANFDFTGGTSIPWTTINSPLGTGLNWNLAVSPPSAVNSGTGLNYTTVLGQFGFAAGTYAIQVTCENASAFVSANPNVNMTVYSYVFNGTGYTITSLGVAACAISGFGQQTKSFTFTTTKNNAFIGVGFQRSDGQTDLNLRLNNIRIISFSSPEAGEPHSYIYSLLKIKKRYRYTDWVNVKIYVEPFEMVNFNSVPLIVDTLYEIVGYNYDVLNNNIELQLAEFIDDGTITIEAPITTLTTVDGN